MYIISEEKRREFDEHSAYPVRSLASKRLSNKKDIHFACESVFKSKIIFATKSPQCNNVKIISSETIQRILKRLSSRLYDYFNKEPKNTINDQNSFDEFHCLLCKEFQTALNRESLTHGNGPITYGNAQKMINMVFKYLSCFGNYIFYADLFSYCHIPIDRYMIRSLKDVYGLHDLNYKLGRPNSKGEVYPTEATYRGVNWTCFDEDTYKSLVKDYRDAEKKLHKLGNHSFLEAEYYWWNKNSAPITGDLPAEGVHAAHIGNFYRRQG